MKWFTCTPVPFGGGPDFFARDSGLLSLGFSEIGVESHAVMPGRRCPEDRPELIRCSDQQLADPKWWSQHQLDGVVLYAWGHPKFRNVARAIRMAGIRLVLNQDSSGIISPLCGLVPWISEQAVISGAFTSIHGACRTSLKIVDGLTRGLLWVDPMRAKHLRHGDVIAAVTPMAVERYRSLCMLYGGRQLAERVHLLPHPVSNWFRYQKLHQKSRRIVSVGRWNDFAQKRPDRLMGVVAKLLTEDGTVAFDIVGDPCADLTGWWSDLPPQHQSRVVLHGRISPQKISEIMQRANILYCPSAYESFHIASGEALCCGMSVVAGKSHSMPAFSWFTEDGDGKLAADHSVESHARAIETELRAWDRMERTPAAISDRWCSRLHASNVARKVLELTDPSS